MCGHLTTGPCQGAGLQRNHWNVRHKKTGSVAGFSGVPGLVGTAWNYVMVPEGDPITPYESKL